MSEVFVAGIAAGAALLSAILTAWFTRSITDKQIDAARREERDGRLRDLRAERVAALREAITEFRAAAGRFVLIDFADAEETTAARRRVREASTMITAHAAPAGVVDKWREVNRMLTGLEERIQADDDQGIAVAAVTCVAITDQLQNALEQWVVDGN